MWFGYFLQSVFIVKLCTFYCNNNEDFGLLVEMYSGHIVLNMCNEILNTKF